MTLACVLLSCGACRGDKPRVPAVPSPHARPAAPAGSPSVVLDPLAPLRVEALGSPVRASRTWTSALVPNKRGGWNFITQSLEQGSGNPPEWIVLDLDTGSFTATEGPRRYAGSNYQVRNQLRAPNGRVFFPLSETGVAYYDPDDEKVKDLPPVISSPRNDDKVIFSAEFGADGMLYGGTQSNSLPTIVQIDPVKLKTRVLGHVGRDRKSYSYAYEIAVDLPWVYAVVGQTPWELAALNIKTGESKILATRSDRPWMKLVTRPEGVRAQLITGVHTPQVVNDYVWCVDGKAIAATSDGKLPFKARKLAPTTTALTTAPELDLTRLDPDTAGVGRVRWRPQGSTEWRTAEFKVKYTVPIRIEALTALPDGSVLGATAQYHGFFRTRGSTSTYLGGPSPSRSKFAVLDHTLYTTGYPNGVLYAYAPDKAWTGTTVEAAAEPGSNPRLVGNFTAAGAKYALFLQAAKKRMYFAGRLERDGVGGAVGYYEPATNMFGGHHDKLADLVPAGLAVLPAIKRVVLSGELIKGAKAEQAELVVYDSDLKELERLVVKPGLTTTGLIFPAAVKSVIVGVLPEALYRYDVSAKRLLTWRALVDPLRVAVQRPGDSSIWGVAGTSLVRFDPLTLEPVTYGGSGTLPAGVDHLVWQGDDLYASVAADLYRIARVGLH